MTRFARLSAAFALFVGLLDCWPSIGGDVSTDDAAQQEASYARAVIIQSVELPCRDADGIALGDLTGNGKLDILASEGKHGTTVWFEQGDDWKQWRKHFIHAIENPRGEIEGNALGDFAGDGKLEAISLNQPRGEIYLHQQDGDPRRPWKTAVIQTNRPFLQDALVTDIDGDGRVDLVYTWEGRAAGEGGVHWLKLVGSNPLDPDHWRDHVMTQHESAWWLAPRLLDIAGDGKATDIVFTARHLLQRNRGSRPGLFWMQPADDVTAPWIVHSIDESLPHPLHVDIGDLSGAGHGLDLVVSGFATDTIYWYDFSNAWKRHELKLPKVNGVDPNTVWNVKTIPVGGQRDAILAPVIRGKRGGLLLFQFHRDAYRPHLLRQLDYGHPMDDRILLHDVSGDGSPEVFVPDSGPGIDRLHIFQLGEQPAS
jgi:hypothetical protein